MAIVILNEVDKGSLFLIFGVSCTKLQLFVNIVEIFHVEDFLRE